MKTTVRLLAGLALAFAARDTAFALPPRVVSTVNPAAVPGAPHATTTDYTHDSAIDPGGGRVATSANYTNRPGYVGQLFDVTALVVAATPVSVNERTTTQLGVGATLDDGTFLVPPAGHVAWSVVSGPVTAINTAGIASADTVYQNTGATVQGRYGGVTASLTITVLNVFNDDFGAYAGDGLPDNWQVSNFGVGNAQAGPTANPDGDGQDNLLEFLAGTNPNLAASLFTVRVDPVPGQPARKAVVFGPVVAGRTYRVLSSTDLAAASWADLSGSLTGASGNLTFTDTAATGARKFYRVQISNP